MTIYHKAALSPAIFFRSTKSFKLLLQHGGDVASIGSLDGKTVM